MLCTAAVYPPFPEEFTALLCSRCALWKNIEVFPRLEFGGFSTPLPNVFVECCRLWQKGDTFWHQNAVGNCLTSWYWKFLPLFELVDKAGEGFWGVIVPHHLCWIFFWVGFFNCPVQHGNMPQYLSRAGTCPNPVSWSMIDDRNTCFIAMNI